MYFLIQLLNKKLYIINILVYGKLQSQSIMLDYFKIKKIKASILPMSYNL